MYVSTGYLSNSFDLFNVAHVDLVAEAARRSDVLVVGVLDDDTVLARTGRAPVVPLVERLEIVRHVAGVTEVVVHGHDHAERAAATAFVGLEDAAFAGEEAVVLEQVRSSASPVLRSALRPLTAEAVA